MNIKSLLLAGAFAVAGFTANAGNASLFSYDKSAVSNSTKNVAAVENYVNQNEGVTLSTMNADGQTLANVANLTEESSLSALMFDGPAGVDSFIWGLCLSWVGLLIVYLVTQDGDETKKALYGCLLSGLFWVVLNGTFCLLGVSFGPWYWLGW